VAFIIVDRWPAVDKTLLAGQHGDMKRMSLAAFERLVAMVMETLPPDFKPFLDNVAVEVALAPDIDTLRQAGMTDEEIEQGDSLFGLFEPFPIASAWSGDTVDIADLPHRLIIYKQPHEEEFRDPKRLRIEVRKTVIHELAHHFGLSDRDLERFDENPNPFDKPAEPDGQKK
jgi:predicted Zn-dependent protease with MMP-like domain